MSSIHARTVRSFGLCLTISLIAVAAPPKRALTHKDYDGWRSISSPTLSRNGEWLAYSLMPQEGDGDLVVRNLKSRKETRHVALDTRAAMSVFHRWVSAAAVEITFAQKLPIPDVRLSRKPRKPRSNSKATSEATSLHPSGMM